MEVLYDNIGLDYNLTRQTDPYISDKLFQFLSPKPDKLYLDIGCGTGNYTIALSNKGLNFYGIEPSKKMLEKARSRSNEIIWLQGTAEQIPLDENKFDGVIATLTIHHWTDIKKALEEIHRVLKDDGKIVFFTALPEQMRGYWLNHYFPKMIGDSISQMLSFESIKDALVETGFIITTTEKYFIQDDLQDNFLYTGKNRPQLYLDKEIRKGISSFSVLANAEEVGNGLLALESDIVLNKFEEIKAKFENDLGDYSFICAQKL